jgi:threonine dehydrogenase-like Zn-dependent dehydrogenase
VTVIGDGAVGLSAVIAAKRLGAEQIILMGGNKDRTDLGRDFGATEIIAERGEEAVKRLRQLTGNQGTHTVLDCVGTRLVLDTAFGAVRDGASSAGPQFPSTPRDRSAWTCSCATSPLPAGATPARAYMEHPLPDVLDGTIQPGRVFDRTISLNDTPHGYRAMDSREALKILIQP